jgi:hypothetical protein
MRICTLPAFAAACALLITSSAARAGADQTWVSPNGVNSGSCPITAPCQTFQYAYNQTNAGGVVSVLASGEFGPLVISKSISIVAEHAEGAIFGSSSGAAIIVNGAGIEVKLRGLTIDPLVAGNHAIRFAAGAALHIQNCAIRATGIGIKVQTAGAGTNELYISDTTIMNANDIGIFVHPTGGSKVKLTMERVLVENSTSEGMSFYASGASIDATVRNSAFVGNNDFGITAYGSVNAMLDRIKVTGSSLGIGVDTGATVRIADSVITGNNEGIAGYNGGIIASFVTNKIDGNYVNGTPNTTISLQ